MLRLGTGSLAILVGACSDPAQSRAGQTDDLLVERLLSATNPSIPKRATAYRLARTQILPAGRTVRVEAGTRIRWEGGKGTGEAPEAVFRAGGANCGIVIDGGTADIECAEASPYVYAVSMEGQEGLSVVGLQAHNCQHVRVHNRRPYAEIRTSGPRINVARRIRIKGGGSRFTTPQKEGHGSCLLEFVADCRVEDAHYENVGNGVQWWGGNANPDPSTGDGKPGNERKCLDVTIERVSVINCFAGIWGAMGRDVMVRNCLVDTAVDVGFDAEGCEATTFERCTSRNGYNGCFSTFFLCDKVRFIDCTGVVEDKSRPLIRVYNSTLSNEYNKGLEVVGGQFECRDRSGPGVIDTAAGPVQTITISNTQLINVRLDLAHHNMHRTRVVGNILTFPYPLPSVAAIRAGASKTIDTPSGRIGGAAVIERNEIRYTATSAGGAKPIAIELHEDDFNASAEDRIVSNTVTGPFTTAVSLISASANPGIRPRFDVVANQFDGIAAGPLLRISRGIKGAADPEVRWDERQTRDGRVSLMRDALR